MDEHEPNNEQVMYWGYGIVNAVNLIILNQF